MDRGDWPATVLRITKSQKQLKRLSMHALQGTHPNFRESRCYDKACSISFITRQPHWLCIGTNQAKERKRERKEERKKERERKENYLYDSEISDLCRTLRGSLVQISSFRDGKNQSLERLCDLPTVTQPAQPNHTTEHRSELKPFDI